MMNRRILVTGAAGGLGTALVREFAGRGAEVLALDVRPVAACRGVTPVLCDLLDLSALSATLSSLQTHGAIDTLINNAAIYPLLPFDEMDIAAYRKVQAVNVEASVILMQHVLPEMRKQRFGRIINITSITLSGQWDHLSAYVASKGALLGLTRAWAREFGPDGITVNAISPGAIPTEAEAIFPDPEGYSRMVIDRQSIKRRGSAQDVAHCALFLADVNSGFMSGQTLHVDGGWTMQ